MQKDNTVKKHAYFNNQFFGRWAWLYDFEKYFFFPIRKKAARFLGLTPPKKILDVATGTGAQAYELAKLGHDVIGVDLSFEMLQQAKKKINSKLKLIFKKADGTDLPFKNNVFDAVSISWGLHDMPYKIGIKVLKEMKRVAKKNGKILIIDYMEPKKNRVAKFTHPLINLYETKNYLPFIRNGIDSYIKKTGLKIIKEDNFLGILQILVLEK